MILPGQREVLVHSDGSVMGAHAALCGLQPCQFVHLSTLLWQVKQNGLRSEWKQGLEYGAFKEEF